MHTSGGGRSTYVEFEVKTVAMLRALLYPAYVETQISYGKAKVTLIEGSATLLRLH